MCKIFVVLYFRGPDEGKFFNVLPVRALNFRALNFCGFGKNENFLTMKISRSMVNQCVAHNALKVVAIVFLWHH